MIAVVYLLQLVVLKFHGFFYLAFDLNMIDGLVEVQIVWRSIVREEVFEVACAS